ncbi:hypothetical protein J7T55_006882 [Diaporthe amygdali]|uniref:uncharacterized protein n=1 Tax=Phomopsis amygdali TaxID=1214568 RepID=UPI0022FEA0D5|nr:uncharacterized protein J7T55_006882 [Diaporthe amygdali]KAJ0125533.1 hypothetical protein J7T55_006882 [Diaporthe amygdali]
MSGSLTIRPSNPSSHRQGDTRVLLSHPSNSQLRRWQYREIINHRVMEFTHNGFNSLARPKYHIREIWKLGYACTSEFLYDESTTAERIIG